MLKFRIHWIKFGNDVTPYIRNHNRDGSCLHPTGTLKDNVEKTKQNVFKITITKAASSDRQKFILKKLRQ